MGVYLHKYKLIYPTITQTNRFCTMTAYRTSRIRAGPEVKTLKNTILENMSTHKTLLLNCVFTDLFPKSIYFLIKKKKQTSKHKITGSASETVKDDKLSRTIHNIRNN